MMRRRLRASAPLAGLALAILAAELGLRLLAPVDHLRPVEPGPKAAFTTRVHRPGTLPGLEYELAPGVESRAGGYPVRIGSLGLRGPEVAREKPAGVVRIAAVGDSFTFGHGVPAEDSYPALLARLVARHGPTDRTFEVLNFGVVGYATRDEAIVVRHRVLAFDPDVIVLGYVLNDPDAHPDEPLHQAFHPLEPWRRSELLRLVAAWRHRRALAAHGGSRLAWLHDPTGSPWRTVVEGFADIRAAADGAGVPVVLVIFPLIGAGSWDAYPLPEVHGRVAAEGIRAGFAVLDLLEVLPGVVARPADLALEHDAHGSRGGNLVFAGAIQRFLAERFPELFAGR